MSALFSRLFPIPSFFTIPTVGLDFSDATMRFVKLRQGKHGLIPESFAELSIPPGCMQGGRIGDEKKFADFLRAARKKYGMKYVRVSIPESQVYSFTLLVDAVVKDDIRGSIELVLEDNIPLKAAEAIFDYHVLASDEKSIIVQVVALSQKVADAYLAAFTASGLVPVSFELDGQASARAIIRPDDQQSYMLVDFGANRTGITIVTSGAAVYTSTLDFGGASLVTRVTEALSIPVEEAHRLTHLYGLNPAIHYPDLAPLLTQGVAALKEEINRRYVYWHEKKDQFRNVPAIKLVYLCGGYGTIEGLADYLSAQLKLSVVPANPWINCLSFDNDIPILTNTEAQSYVTAIGLALTDYLYD